MSDAINSASATTNITATMPPWANPTSAARKAQIKSAAVTSALSTAKVMALAQQSHAAHEGVGDRVPDGRFERGELACA